MTQKHFILFPLLALLLLSGCVDPGYQPPQRPLAYMYPTLMPGTQLQQLKSVEVTVALLGDYLKTLGLWEPLVAAGLTDGELTTVVRSLAHRGYVLEVGRITLSGPARDLLANPQVRDAYLGGE